MDSMRGPRLSEIAKPDQEPHKKVSELPKKANPTRYFRSKYIKGTTAGTTAYGLYPEADAEDSLQFRLRKQDFMDRMDELQDSRFRLQTTGVTLDMRLLNDMAERILEGLKSSPKYATSPDSYLRNFEHFVALSEFLTHLGKKNIQDAINIKNKMAAGVNLLPEETELLSHYLRYRDTYID